MPRYALEIAYHGHGFAGLWRHPDQRTVSGELIAACRRFGEHIDDPIPASRTDSGVHARGNVVSIDCVRTWRPDNLHGQLEHHLPPDLACQRSALVSDTWDARDSKNKTYQYTIDRSMPRDPLQSLCSWRVEQRLDVGLLSELAGQLIGQHCMSAFTKRGDHNENRELDVSRAHWSNDQHGLHFTITANRFGYHMVRSLVGAQIHIASGARPRSDWSNALAGIPVPAANEVAPAHGLCLQAVRYTTDPWPHAHHQQQASTELSSRIEREHD